MGSAHSFANMGKVHGSLARAGKVRGQTPKVAPQDKKKTPKGRAKKRILYNRRPGLYYVDDGGQRLEGSLFSVGSGSLFAYGVLDEGYSYELGVEAAKELATRSIYHATYRDAASGGFVNLYHMKETGWEHCAWHDVKDLHWKYHAEKAQAAN